MNRPEIKKIIQSIERKDVENLIICKLDSLTRSLQDLLKLIELCTDNDVNLISIDENINLSTAAGRLLVHILGIFAQFDRDNISARTVSGLKEKARQGEYPWGLVPYGYSKTENRILYQVEEEIKVIKKLHKKYCLDNLSEKAISNTMKKIYNINVSERDVVKWLSKPIYMGDVIIKGESFKIIEPIFSEEELKAFEKRRKLYSFTQREYIYLNTVYINGELCQHETAKKKLASGSIKYYTYYKIPKYIRIREETITKFIQKYHKLEEEIRTNKYSEDVSQITDRYLKKQITDSELIRLLDKAKDIENKFLDIKRIDITVNETKNIESVSVN